MSCFQKDTTTRWVVFEPGRRLIIFLKRAISCGFSEEGVGLHSAVSIITSRRVQQYWGWLRGRHIPWRDSRSLLREFRRTCSQCAKTESLSLQELGVGSVENSLSSMAAKNSDDIIGAELTVVDSRHSCGLGSRSLDEPLPWLLRVASERRSYTIQITPCTVCNSILHTD